MKKSPAILLGVAALALAARPLPAAFWGLPDVYRTKVAPALRQTLDTGQQSEPTRIPAEMPSATLTPPATATASPSASATPSSTPLRTPTVTATPTGSPSGTPTPTTTPTLTASATASPSPTASCSPTATPSATWTPLPSCVASYLGSGSNAGGLALDNPDSVVFDPATGHTLVALGSFYQVAILDGNGNLLHVIGNPLGEPGNLPGEFSQPPTVGVDSSGNILASDYTNGRVQAFAPDGTFIDSVNVPIYTNILSVDPAGTFYFTSSGNYDITAYDFNIGTHSFTVQPHVPAMGVYSGGNPIFGAGGGGVWLNNGAEQFLHYSVTGALLGTVLLPGYSGFPRLVPNSAVLDASGQFIISGYLNPTPSVIISPYVGLISAGGSLVGVLATSSTAQTAVSAVQGVALDSSGDVLISDANNNRIEVVTEAGAYVKQFGAGSGTAPGLFNFPNGVAIGPGGDVYVTDYSNPSVQIYDTQGNFKALFGPATFQCPQGLAFDASGNLFVIDACAYTVTKLSPAGVPLLSFGGQGGGDGQLSQPTSIAVAPGGDVVVLDNDRVETFDNQGNFVNWYGGAGTGLGDIAENAYGIAVSTDGSVFVCDTQNNRVEAFAPDGSVTQIGRGGSAAGTLSLPSGLAFGADGSLYVTEQGNHRLQIFNPQGQSVKVSGAFGYTSGMFDLPGAVALDGAGTVYVADLGNHRVYHFCP